MAAFWHHVSGTCTARRTSIPVPACCWAHARFCRRISISGWRRSRQHWIVVHGISLPAGEFGTPWIDRLFSGNLPADGHESFTQIATLRVSAHAVIRRDGAADAIRAVLPARAWHAGKSSYQGREACNDFSIGIELEGTDHIAYTPAQYLSLAQLIKALCLSYPTLDTHHLVGHRTSRQGARVIQERLLTGRGCARYWSECSLESVSRWRLRCHKGSVPVWARANTRASTNSRSERRFR